MPRPGAPPLVTRRRRPPRPSETPLPAGRIVTFKRASAPHLARMRTYCCVTFWRCPPGTALCPPPLRSSRAPRRRRRTSGRASPGCESVGGTIETEDANMLHTRHARFGNSLGLAVLDDFRRPLEQGHRGVVFLHPQLLVVLKCHRAAPWFCVLHTAAFDAGSATGFQVLRCSGILEVVHEGPSRATKALDVGDEVLVPLPEARGHVHPAPDS